MRKWLLGLAAGLAIVLLGAADGWTKGKPGGGGSVPAGVIYGDSGDAIDAAGSVLDSGLPPGWPSYARHGGDRWFAWYRDNGGGDVRLTVTSEAGTEYDLTPSTTGQTMIFYGLIRWAKDDAALYYVAKVWFGAGTFDFDSHILRLPVDWTTGAPVASGVPTSVAEATGADDANPLFGEFDVSPAGDRLVYLDKANTNTANMYVETIGTGTRTLLASAPVFDPSWSPGGTHIAYTVDNGTGLVTLKPDGSDSRLFQPSSGKRYQYPRWSPDSAHLAFLQRSGRLLATYRTGRIEVATGVVTILDADLTPTGWRNP